MVLETRGGDPLHRWRRKNDDMIDRAGVNTGTYSHKVEITAENTFSSASLKL